MTVFGIPGDPLQWMIFGCPLQRHVLFRAKALISPIEEGMETVVLMLRSGQIAIKNCGACQRNSFQRNGNQSIILLV